jgi:hypothetical protein
MLVAAPRAFARLSRKLRLWPHILARPMSTAFLLCVERGSLEAQSLLCVESLRAFGGALAEAPVYAFAPRPGSEPAAETIAALRDLGASYVDEPLNEEMGKQPHTNKVFVAAWAEANLEHDVLAFTDSDTVFLAEPAELGAGDWQAAVRPVGSVNKGSTGEGHENEEAWQTLYEVLGVSARPFVETVVERDRIRAYFNAGLVALRRDSGLGTAWRDATLELRASAVGGRPHYRRQIDQLSLAGVLADRMDRVKLLPDTYGYPLPKRIKLPAEMQALDLADLVHVHGHRWLHLPGLLREVDPPLDETTEAYRWLDERLPLEPTIEGPFRFPRDGEED